MSATACCTWARSSSTRCTLMTTRPARWLAGFARSWRARAQPRRPADSSLSAWPVTGRASPPPPPSAILTLDRPLHPIPAGRPDLTRGTRMALDQYSPCPCGSGKKFKWCCQPIHVQITRAFQQDVEGQHDVALRTMDEIAAEHGGNPEVWGRKAQLLYQMDKVDEAENALQRAFDLNPNYPFGHFLRGKFRHMEGELPGALLQFRKAASL